MNKPNILAIVGSMNADSINARIIHKLKISYGHLINIDVYEDIASLPHFSPHLDTDNAPESVVHLRELLTRADGVLFCTPEYIFSLPSIVKNIFEWMVSTVIFTDKPSAFIIAASSGDKAFEQMQLMLTTVGAKMSLDSNVLIKGVKSKTTIDGDITDIETKTAIDKLIAALVQNINK
ncbi:MAG: NADPH-dependent FMN reductase [Bacteroidota bacterium]